MNKNEFLNELRVALNGIPKENLEERLEFYGEIIDDRMEEGLSEEAAVKEMGLISEVAAQVLKDVPLSSFVKEKVAPKRKLRGFEILLIILGFPLWFSLLVAVFAVIFAVYIVIWALILSLFAIAFSFGACALGGIIAAVVFAVEGHYPVAVAVFGAALCLAGLSVLLFYLCRIAPKGVLTVTNKAVLKLKAMLKGKENAK